MAILGGLLLLGAFGVVVRLRYSAGMSGDRHVVQCNYTTPTGPVAASARAYLVRPNPGGGNDRIVVLVRSRGGRWIEKWEDIKRLGTFRVKTLPPEHPLHGDERLYDYEPYVMAKRLMDAFWRWS